MTDTHTHLYLDDFENGGDTAVLNAIANGVTRLIMPNVNAETIEPMQTLAARFPDNIFMAMGLHPTELDGDWHATLDTIMRQVDNAPDRYVAVGEIGIDLHWDTSNLDNQQQAFARQLELAKRHHLPIIIHCREALNPTLEVMQDFKGIKGVFHSFGGTAADIELIRRDHDMYFGINGIVTFKNSNLRYTLPLIGLDRLLLETDAPYLAPVPMRGRRNESAYLVHTANHIASHLNIPLDKLIQTTDANATRLFNLPR